jgi:hypothetical protein
MAAQVLSFFQRSPRYAPAPAADWTQQELAEFYRVEAALIRAGIRVGTDRGMSDENEPWFVFYRTDDGEVVIHFARIDGEYLIAGPAYEEIARGFDFSSLVRNMVARHPLIRRSDRGDNISIHPAALLVAVVGTAFFKSGEARAAESGASNPPSHARPALLSSSSSASLNGVAVPAAQNHAAYDTVQLPANQAVLVMAAALFASEFSVDTASLAPSTQAALASAAAALDFGGPVAPASSLTSTLAASPAADTSAALINTPAHTVSSVLSLVALLSTLSQGHEIASPTAGLTLDDDAPKHVAAMDPLAAPTAHDTANWSLEVRLGSGALPNVEAVQLVRAAIGDVAAQKISVVEVSKLPDVLAELIAKADHYDVSPAPIATVPEPTIDQPAPTTPDDLGAIAPVKPAEPIQPVADPKPTPHFASVDLVKEFISFFVAHTSGIEVVQRGQEIVMFDARVLHDVGSISLLHAVTFDFADGGAITLVGDHTAFLDVNWV